MNRQEVLQTISDISKEACGYRVRLDYQSMTDEELFAQYDRFYEQMLVREAQEKVESVRAQKEWESDISNMMTDHGISRATAIRWDIEAYGAQNQEYGYYCYVRGIEYKNEFEIAELLGKKVFQ